MEFELWAPDGETLYSTTNFQAIKYLSKEQREYIEIFEYVMKYLKCKKKHFGRYLDMRKEMDTLNSKDPRYENVLFFVSAMKAMRI